MLQGERADGDKCRCMVARLLGGQLVTKNGMVLQHHPEGGKEGRAVVTWDHHDLMMMK